MQNKYVRISPGGELMGEPSLVPPEYWATPKKNILTEIAVEAKGSLLFNETIKAINVNNKEINDKYFSFIIQ